MADREQQREHEANYIALAETLPVIVWTAMPDGTVDFISQDIYNFTGFEKSDLPADAWLNALHPDDREPCMATWQAAVESGSDYHIEFRIYSAAEDDYRWHLVRARLTRDENGNPLKWYGAAIDIHGRRQAEEALQHARRHSELLLESSGEGIHGIDRNGHVIFQNTAARKILGYPIEEILNKHSHQTIHYQRPDGSDYPVEDCPIFRTLSDGKTRHRDDEMFFHKDGRPVHVAYTVAAMTSSDDGEITGAVVNFRDITTRYRDQRLREVEARILDDISSGKRLTDILDPALRTVEELLPGAKTSILLIEDGHVRHLAAPALPKAYLEAIDGEPIGPEAGSCGTAAWDNRQVIVEDIATDPLWENYRDVAMQFGLRACWSTPITDAQGQVLATFAAYYDQPRAPERESLALIERISRFIGTAIERTRQTERLRESEERFRLVTRATSDLVYDWNLQDNRIWWSEGMKRRFGYSPEQYPETLEDWQSLVHPDDLDRVMSSLEEALESGSQFWQAEYRFRAADGEYLLVRDSGYLLTRGKGQAKRMLGSMVDISRVKELEQQLHQAQRLEVVGQLTGGIAHDFNNLLTVILGNAELLTDELEDQPEIAGLASMIHAAAARGGELTERLLAFARQQMLEPASVDINALIKGMEPLLRRTLSANIELQILTAKELWPAVIDSAQLESALLNLCLNARDAMADGGQLTIETANDRVDGERTDPAMGDDATEFVRVTVRDTGAGMTKEVAQKAFEPFFTTKQTGQGTGLGLSMVYGFVKQSGGHVNIESEPGSGTKISLCLPRSDREPERSEPGSSEPRSLASAGTELILVVEDNELVREHVAASLQRLGYRVRQASDGISALKLIVSEPDIDLLFTDVVMPGGISGRDLADQVRQIRPDLPVLFTSGYTQHTFEDDEAGLSAGMQLLQKPYRREELARMVQKALNPGKA